MLKTQKSPNPTHSASVVIRGENRREEKDDFGDSHLGETDLRLETFHGDIVSISEQYSFSDLDPVFLRLPPLFFFLNLNLGDGKHPNPAIAKSELGSGSDPGRMRLGRWSCHRSEKARGDDRKEGPGE